MSVVYVVRLRIVFSKAALQKRGSMEPMEPPLDPPLVRWTRGGRESDVRGRGSTANMCSAHALMSATTMKGTEVPNPRRSSACDCTCVLTRIDHCLVNNSIMMFALELIWHAF